VAGDLTMQNTYLQQKPKQQHRKHQNQRVVDFQTQLKRTSPQDMKQQDRNKMLGNLMIFDQN